MRTGRNWSNFEDTHTHAAKLVVEICWSSIPCVLLKVVSYYYLSVLSMSMISKKTKVWMGGGVGGWDDLYPVLFRIFFT